MSKMKTADAFFNGKLKVNQDRKGYRFSIDAVLLAYHVRPKPGDRVLDLGTGCGIIPLIVAHRNPLARLYGVEIQETLAEYARQNVELNGLDKRIHIICQDMRKIHQRMFQGPMDVVVSNPPFRKAASGRINPDNQRAVARHEIMVTLSEVVETAAKVLKTAGKFILIYSSERIADLLMHMRACHIEPKNIRFIHAKKKGESKLMIVEGLKRGKPGLTVASPVVIYKADGTYSREVATMFLPDIEHIDI